MAEPEDLTHIEITPQDFKAAALEELTEIDEMLNDPAMIAIMGEDLIAGVRAINDEKIALVKEIPDV